MTCLNVLVNMNEPNVMDVSVDSQHDFISSSRL